MNKKLLFFLIVTGFSLVSAVYQYIREFQSEFASAAYSSKPAAGHSWSEMECTNGLCVTTDNKVGIGTDSPSQKLEVVGNVKVADICADSGCLNSLFQIVNTTLNQELYNHSTTLRHAADCTAIGGNTVNVAAGVSVCQITGASCPSNWNQYLNWSVTTANNSSSVPCCTGGSCPALDCANRVYCNTGSHTWANIAVESCQAANACGLQCSGQASATATRTQIGCY